MKSNEMFKAAIFKKIDEELANFFEDMKCSKESGWNREEIWEEFDTSYSRLEDQLETVYMMMIEDEEEWEEIVEKIEEGWNKAEKFLNEL